MEDLIAAADWVAVDQPPTTRTAIVRGTRRYSRARSPITAGDRRYGSPVDSRPRRAGTTGGRAPNWDPADLGGGEKRWTVLDRSAARRRGWPGRSNAHRTPACTPALAAQVACNTAVPGPGRRGAAWHTGCPCGRRRPRARASGDIIRTMKWPASASLASRWCSSWRRRTVVGSRGCLAVRPTSQRPRLTATTATAARPAVAGRLDELGTRRARWRYASEVAADRTRRRRAMAQPPYRSSAPAIEVEPLRRDLRRGRRQHHIRLEALLAATMHRGARAEGCGSRAEMKRCGCQRDVRSGWAAWSNWENKPGSLIERQARVIARPAGLQRSAAATNGDALAAAPIGAPRGALQ